MTQTGITFTNMLSAERLLENQVWYNGSGVAAGDIDGDGLCDLFFCSLEGRSHLYRNLGGWRFEEVTASAGVGCEGLLTSGAVLVDIDGDGDLDLLVNAYANGTQLFLNDGRGHFTERKDSGLQQNYSSISLALADVDGNGTLDLYVANYLTRSIADSPGVKFTVQRVDGKLTVSAVNGVSVQSDTNLQNKYIVDSSTGDVMQLGEPDIFYINNGNAQFQAQSWVGGRFREASGKPITSAPYDYGLSVMFRDLDGDGLPDLYVCNDLFTPDRIWLNKGNGIFQAASNFAVRHISESSMGVDVADINRDGTDDLIVVDMLSREHKLRVMQVIGQHQEVCVPGLIDTRPAYNRNMLFLGRGDGTYAEIAFLAGLEASEWSWAPAFLDVDLDGYEDVLMTTGYFRDSLNMDLRQEFDRYVTGKHLTPAQKLQLRGEIYKPHRRPNVAFRNRGDLTFEDASGSWHFNEFGIKQGMCLADLDNDGDPDVIINNFGDPPSLYLNEASAPRVAVRLKGLAPNTAGIGSKIYVRGGPVTQSQQMICGGRYLSNDDEERVFAFGNATGPRTIEVAWRSGRRSLLTDVRANCIYEIDEAQAQAESISNDTRVKSAPWFRDVSDQLRHVHQEKAFNDFVRQPLLSRKLSQAGPGMAWLDVNGDGSPDLVIGGGRGGELSIFLNDGNRGFNQLSVPSALTRLTAEEGAIVGLPSLTRTNSAAMLAVAQSNYEAPCSNSVLLVRSGQAGLEITGALPSMESCPGAVVFADVDGDGYLDLFVGGRVIPGRYPLPATSLLYKGQSDGGFVVDTVNSGVLKNVGLVNGASFTDLDGDGWPDLVLAVMWGPVRVFHNDKGTLRESTSALGLEKFTGWWNGVAAGDFDADGRMDLVAGNWGRNSKYERYRAKPLKLFYGDWNRDGQIEVFEAGEDPLTHKTVCLKGFEPVRDALPWVGGQFSTFAAFGEASVHDILGDQFKHSRRLEAATLETTVFLNRGDHFEARKLPAEAQFSPAFGICVADFNGDGIEDIFLAQNFYPVDAESSRLDAGRGLLLEGNGKGEFLPLGGQSSGIEVYGDQRGAAVCDYDRDGRPDLAVSQNGAATRLYHNEQGRPGLRVTLAGEDGNPAGFGAQLRLLYADSKGPVREVHGGGGYWSQDDSTQVLGKRGQPVSLWVRWPGGKVVTYDLNDSTTEITAHLSGQAELK